MLCEGAGFMNLFPRVDPWCMRTASEDVRANILVEQDAPPLYLHLCLGHLREMRHIHRGLVEFRSLRQPRQPRRPSPRIIIGEQQLRMEAIDERT